MNKKKTQADEERLTLYENMRDAAVEVSKKTRKAYDFIGYMAMMGTLVCLTFSQTRFAFLCMLLALLAMNMSLIFRTKEGILDSMVSEDQMEKFFKKLK